MRRLCGLFGNVAGSHVTSNERLLSTRGESRVSRSITRKERVLSHVSFVWPVLKRRRFARNKQRTAPIYKTTRGESRVTMGHNCPLPDPPGARLPSLPCVLNEPQTVCRLSLACGAASCAPAAPASATPWRAAAWPPLAGPCCCCFSQRLGWCLLPSPLRPSAAAAAEGVAGGRTGITAT